MNKEAPVMRVSVVIPTYNHGPYIACAIRSVLGQTYPPLEIIVIDDGSTDGTAELVQREFGEQVQFHYQSNRGPGAARNTGVRLSSGDWVAFLDADDYWKPEKLELQIAEIARVPGVRMVVCEGVKCNIQGEVLQRFTLPQPFSRAAIRAGLIRRCLFAMPGVMVHRDVFGLLGGFREELLCGEDHEMWARIAASYEIAAVHQPLFVVIPRLQSLSDDPLWMGRDGFIALQRVRELLGGYGSWPRTWLDGRQAEARQLLYAAHLYSKRQETQKAALTAIRGLVHWPFLPIRYYKSVVWHCTRMVRRQVPKDVKEPLGVK